MNLHRVLMATDVPFWRKSTGAEQRMASLIRFLSSNEFEVRTFYLGQTGSAQFTERDRRLISEQDLDVEQKSSDQLPQQLANKIGWYAQATKNQLQQWTRKPSLPSSEAQSPAIPRDTPTLDQYRWPWAIAAFRESVDAFQPDSIIIQYIKLSYLLESLNPRQFDQIHTLVDTHDLLHRRAAQFRERGFQHWIELTHAEESAELNKFQTIIAIQDEEAKLFREMAPASKTIVCGHCVEYSNLNRTVPGQASSSAQQHPENGKLTIGYLGSANASNAQAVESFLEHVWRPLLDSESAKQFQFVIAGGICQWLVQSDIFGELETGQVDLLGGIADLETFYNRVDLVVNPVEFGTGLKIKNCEAIAYGKPVLTTDHGNVGFAADVNTATLICRSSQEFFDRLCELAADSQLLNRLQDAATELSQAGFSDERVYSELKQALLQSK